jgi:hypothetical protein
MSALRPQSDGSCSVQSPFTICLDQFSVAAGRAALLEAQTRLLADKTAELQHLSLAGLERVEEAVLKHFGEVLSSDEAASFRSCRVVRNKLLHMELWTAKERLIASGIQVKEGRVLRMNIETETITNAEAERGNGHLFGWVLSLGQSGALVHATSLFDTGLRIVQRLATTQ